MVAQLSDKERIEKIFGEKFGEKLRSYDDSSRSFVVEVRNRSAAIETAKVINNLSRKEKNLNGHIYAGLAEGGNGKEVIVNMSINDEDRNAQFTAYERHSKEIQGAMAGFKVYLGESKAV